jgi:hypothetical protein
MVLKGKTDGIRDEGSDPRRTRTYNPQIKSPLDGQLPLALSRCNIPERTAQTFQPRNQDN